MLSLLNGGKDVDLSRENTSLFVDLNIDQIIANIVEDWELEIGNLYYMLPNDPEIEADRRAIFLDLKQEEVYAALTEFLQYMKQHNECLERKEKLEERRQQQVWYIRQVACYVKAVECLISMMRNFHFQSEGMARLQKWLSDYEASKEYRNLKEEVLGLEQELKDFRLQLVYENGKFSVSDGRMQQEPKSKSIDDNGKKAGKKEKEKTKYSSYEDFLQKCFPNHNKAFKSPFLDSLEWSDLEIEAVALFQKKHKAFFERAKSFSEIKETYQREEILRLPNEFAYYMAFNKFMNKMQKNGFAFCEPQIGGEKLSAEGLYDLALACVNLKEGKSVVTNDFELWPEENFIVLTGPNQGGKTTFARSLGQMIYFSKMGFDVPATEAKIPYFTEIMTHFSVEESVESGKGKLMDELTRLKPMMQENKKGAFVVINELFTTAANVDACIMGKKVLEHFMENQCKGIYVTHLNELTRAQESVVSYRATLDENAKQTYKVARQVATELAGANIQVEKYHLTYQQIKERFS